MRVIHIKSGIPPTAFRYSNLWSGDKCSYKPILNKHFNQYVNDCCQELKYYRKYYIITGDKQTKLEQLQAIQTKCKFEIIVTNLSNGYTLLQRKRGK